MYRSCVCGIYNSALQVYFTYVCFWFFYTTLPIIAMIIFGLLGYKNIRTLGDRGQLQGNDRQLALMVCGQVVLVIVTTVIYAVFNVYLVTTASVNKSIERLYIEYFIGSVIEVESFVGAGVSGIPFFFDPFMNYFLF